jgi:hypothetical protein
MIPEVVSATYRGEYRIELGFSDGRRGVVDFESYLRRGGVFDRFRDIGFFRDFRVNPELGTLTWKSEIDIAPETLYAAATGAPLPVWMAVSER